MAKPKLQGQAITKMVTKVVNDSLKSLVISKYNIKVMMAIKMTTGTKIPDTLSAILEIGAFVLLASITNLTISDIVESLPIFSALYSVYPS